MSLQIKCACGAEFSRSDTAVSTIVTEKRWVRIHQDHGDRTALRRLAVELAQTKAELTETRQLLADFDNLREQLTVDRHERLEETFREDYEIYGAEDGEVKVQYKGVCSACSLRLTFEHSHPLDFGEES